MEMQMKTSFFSPRRFGQLLLRDLAGGYRSILIAMATVAGVVLIVSALTVLGSGGDASFHLGFFVQTLFFGGFIVTSLAFREVRQNGGGIFYLTIPASTFEKLASKLVVNSVGYSLGLLVFYTALASASEGILRLVFGRGNAFFNPFDPMVLKAVALYLVTQSVYLLGSIWFRKLAFVKTALWLGVFIIGVAIVAAGAVRIIWADHFVLGRLGSDAMRFGKYSMVLPPDIFSAGSPEWNGLLRFKLAAEILLYGALAPVCWLASFFKLSEIEV